MTMKDSDALQIIQNLIPDLVLSYNHDGWANGLTGKIIPSRQSVSGLLATLKSLLFPGFHETVHLDNSNIHSLTGKRLFSAYENLSNEIEKGICHACQEEDTQSSCKHHIKCRKRAEATALNLLRQLPRLREELRLDVEAIFAGDPAAKSHSEVILAYPGMNAIASYRLAHILYQADIPLVPRIMSEIVHQETGIDIHPGATIGESFFIDHGTGIVIGETTCIGNRVKLYHGVTLGAFSVSKDKQTRKRHPTIADNVTVYSNATILGGETIVGEGAVIGANVWLTKSVDPGATIR